MIERCVDVVVDVASSRVDGPFTYACGPVLPALGARVRVPLGSRRVGGWVVTEPRPAELAGDLKAIVEIDASAPALDRDTIALADFLRGRFACSFREAILAAGARGARRSGRPTFAFAAAPDAADAYATALAKRFGARSFTALAARRAVRENGRPVSLDAVQREIDRYVRAGVLVRAETAERRAVAARRTWYVKSADAAKAVSAPHRRLADALAAAGHAMTIADAARAAATTAAVIRRAQAAGVCTIEEAVPAAVRPARPQPDALTEEQARAIEAISAAAHARGSELLVHGVTGSGKTLVYARAIERVRADGGRAIVLVPEISLTPQTAASFEALFGSGVGVVHSALSDGERSRVWQDARAGRIDVVVGARSAVFAPLPDLRMIVVDEEHEPSYKQDVAPRYDAAVVARERMRMTGGVLVLGSATPSLETYEAARSGRIASARMTSRATNAPLPPVEIVDLSTSRGGERRSVLGPALIAAIDAAIRARAKAMLFVNRRGYAGLLLCRSCGFAPRCTRCAVSLVVHAADGSMRCHVCGAAYRVAARCPKCGGADLLPLGFGTQRVEEEVRALFPDAGVVRMDSDTTGRRGAHASLLDRFGSGADVLIGTQMIAKGLDFPDVQVVGVVCADLDLNRPDFRAAERTFGLLTQVAGRAGRAAPGARAIVQTFSPDHYAIRFAARHDYDGFAEKELALRKELRYPPFGSLAYLSLTGADRAVLARVSTELSLRLRDTHPSVEILGPAPEPVSKALGEYRMRIALKADVIGAVLDACTTARRSRLPRGIRLTAIVDPR